MKTNVNMNVVMDLDSELEALKITAEHFWHQSQCFLLSADDKEDILQQARIVMFRRPYDPDRVDRDGKPVPKQRYMEGLLSITYTAWKAVRRVREEAFSQLEVTKSHEVAQEESRMERIPDPLTVTGVRESIFGGVVVHDPVGFDDLTHAPLKVRFRDEESVSRYLRDGLYVPRFDVVPKKSDHIATGTHESRRGARRNFGAEHLPYSTQELLSVRREFIAAFIRELIPEYLKRFGYTSLDREYKDLLRDLNAGLSVPDITRKRGLSRSTCYNRIYILKRRGWMPVWSARKKREVYVYHPALDRCKSFYSDMALDIDARLSISGLIEVSELDFHQLIGEGERHEALIAKSIVEARKRLAEVGNDLQVEREYDAKIRKFIVDFVERPVQTKMPLEEIEDRFREVPESARLDVFCEALRKRCSIYDVLTFSTTFPRELYGNDHDQHRVTLAAWDDSAHKPGGDL